jgi:hypothetical protein
MIGQYNLHNLINSYTDNKDMIKEHFKYKDTLTTPTELPVDNSRILGLTVELFIFLLILSIAIWITAFVLLIKNWKKLSGIVLFFALLTLFTNIGGPIITILLIYLFKKD